MDMPDEEIERLRRKLRFKVSYHVGYACPDLEDLVQETLTRFVAASRENKVRSSEALGAFINGICRNVILEYHRRVSRDEIAPESPPELIQDGLLNSEIVELRDAIARGLQELGDRDRRILREFYLEEKSKEQILKSTGLTEENFRVVLCRAKEKFRAIYLRRPQQKGTSSH